MDSITITVKCVGCGKKKEVITKEQPFCECGSPMFAVKAKLKKEKKHDQRKEGTEEAIDGSGDRTKGV